MRTLNSKPGLSMRIISTLAIPFCLMVMLSCEKSDLTDPTPKLISKVNDLEHSIDLDQVMDNIEKVDVEVTMRSSGYDALAKGRGTIPAGDYAGHHFTVVISAFYSAIGNNTLVTGDAIVRIRGQHFESVENCMSGFLSFCDGEGDLTQSGSDLIFTVYGLVEHLRASNPHKHVFAGLGSTAGTMNITIENQTGSVTEDLFGDNHDPDIGEIWDIPTRQVSVTPH